MTHQPDAKPQIAGLLARFLANVIDGMIISVIVLPLFASQPSGGRGAGSAILFPLLWSIYEAFTVGRFGQTLGKRFLRIRVVLDMENPTPPGYRTAALRYLVKTGEPALLLFVLVLTARWVNNITAVYTFFISVTLLFSKVNRGFHDKAAGTYVVRVPRTKRVRKAKRASALPAPVVVKSASRKKSKKSKKKKR